MKSRCCSREILSGFFIILVVPVKLRNTEWLVEYATTHERGSGLALASTLKRRRTECTIRELCTRQLAALSQFVNITFQHSSDTHRHPDPRRYKVAGATLMALGCNGPELFTNFIAIFITHSAVGVGTIVGSEIFNLLCIVGGSIVCCPKLPLLLEKPPFIRDCAFYGVSIVMLQFTLRDGLVTLPEALTLLAMCGVYATSVAMTAPFLEWWEKRNGGGGSAVAGKFLS